MNDMTCGCGKNPYLPEVATVLEVITESPTIKSFRVRFDNEEAWQKFSHQPGQVGQLSVFGVGESTFVINTPPSSVKENGYIQFSVMRAGEVTTAIHKLKAGDKVGVRAPLGNYFPWESWKGKSVFFVGGGIGMAPIRTIMLHLMERAQDYGQLSLLYGAKSPEDLAYKADIPGWLESKVLKTTLTIDREAQGWEHRVGLIPNVLKEIKPSPDDCIAVLCGPPIMIKFTLAAFRELGFKDENIVTTLERRMKCGIGICGRCNLGSKYVCLDGPVFTQAQLNDLPPEM